MVLYMFVRPSIIHEDIHSRALILHNNSREGGVRGRSGTAKLLSHSVYICARKIALVVVEIVCVCVCVARTWTLEVIGSVLLVLFC